MDITAHSWTKNPAVDPAVQPALDAFAESLPDSHGPMTHEAVLGIRAMFAALPKPTDEELGGEKFVVTREWAPGANGAPDVALLVFRPRTVPRIERTLVWVHGGGMVFGDYRDGLDEMLDYAERVDAALVSVNYRLAPETRHPGPVEDCYSALVWARRNVAPAVVVIGASAGGGLAAGAALMAARRDDLQLTGQMLLAPMLDHRNTALSMRNLPHPTIWSRESNAFGWGALLGSDAADRDVSPEASPTMATLSDLEGLAPTYVDVGGADGFRDEDAEFAIRASQAGVLVEFHLWAGAFHGSEGMAPDAPVSRAMRAARAAWLERLFS